MNKVDMILKNAIIITMDAEFHQYEPGAVDNNRKHDIGNWKRE